MLSTPRASEDDSMSATTRYAAMSRRAAMTAAALTAMVAMSGCGPKTAGAAAGDMAMGAPEQGPAGSMRPPSSRWGASRLPGRGPGSSSPRRR